MDAEVGLPIDIFGRRDIDLNLYAGAFDAHSGGAAARLGQRGRLHLHLRDLGLGGGGTLNLMGRVEGGRQEEICFAADLRIEIKMQLVQRPWPAPTRYAYPARRRRL